MSARRVGRAWLGLGVLVCILLGALVVMPAAAFAATGRITGTATDAKTGAPIAGAWLWVSTPDGPGWSSVSTNDRGQYTTSYLPEGDYTIYANRWSTHYEQWYDRKYLWSHADRVHVAEGDVVADITMDPVVPLAPDAAESDNTFAQAQVVVTDGAERRATAFPSGDVDFCKFPVKRGRIYTVNAVPLWDGSHYAWPQIELFDGQRRPVTPSGWDSVTYLAKADGYAYSRVSFSGSIGDYVYAVDEMIPGTIAGKVIADDTQQPLEKVRVELYRYADSNWGNWIDWVGTQDTDAMGQYTFGALETKASYRVGFSTVRLPDYASEYYDNLMDVYDPASATPVRVGPGETAVANASLARAATISGTVTDEASGDPIADVSVDVYGGEVGLSTYRIGTATTDSLGRYSVGSLTPGSYKVAFADQMSGYLQEYYSDKSSLMDADSVALVSGDTLTINEQLALNPDVSSVRGVVIDKADGAPVDDAKVQVEPVGWTDSSGYHMGDPLGGLSSGYSSGYWAYTNSDGSYRIGGLGAGLSPDTEVKWRITFSDPHNGYLPQCFDGKQPGEDPDEVALPRGGFFEANAQLEANPETAKVVGRVTDAESGAPIVGAWVNWGTKSGYDMSGYGTGSSSYGMSTYAYTNSDGEFSLRGVPSQTLVILSAAAEDLPRMFYDHKPTADTADELVFEPSEQRTVDFALRGWGQLKGRVAEDDTGKALEGIKVSAFSNAVMSGTWGSGFSTYGSVVTGEDGSYVIDHLNPYATYKLHFVDQGPDGHQDEWYDNQSSEGDANEVQIPVDSSLTFDASLARSTAIGAVSGTVSRKSDGTPLAMIQVDVFSGTANPDGSVSIGDLIDREHTVPDGTYRISGLPAGQYYVKFSDPLGRVAAQWFDNQPVASDRPQIVVVPAGGAGPGVNASLYEADRDAPSATDDVRTPYYRSATIKVGAFDAVSGLKSITYSLDGQEAITSDQATVTIAVSSLGTHTLEYWAEDFAGNRSSTVTREFSVLAYGSVTGSVTSSGTPLSGVSVKVGSADSVVTDEDGCYEVGDLVPGTYDVEFSKTGFVAYIANGVEVSSGATTTRDASLTPLTFAIGATAGPGGTITPTQTVLWGEDATVTITPAVGYHIVDVKVDGVSQGAVASYTFVEVTADHTVVAAFAPNAVNKSAITVKRYPAGAVLHYKRRHGVATYTLSAKFTDSARKRITGLTVYLQSSANGRSWANNAALVTDSSGEAERSFRIKRKRVRYYRWYAPETAKYYAAYTSEQKVVVK